MQSRLPINMRYGLAAFSAAFSIVAGALFADDITLRFPDGSLEVSGPLLGFDGLSYRVDTRFGVLTLSVKAVDCVAGCPGTADVPVVRMGGAQSMADVLTPALVQSFAISLGLSTDVGTGADGALGITLFAAEEGPVARFEIAAMPVAAAFDALQRGGTDIVLSDRPVTEAERAALLAADLGDLNDPLRRRLMARKSLRLVTHRAQSVRDIQADQVLGVLSGTTSNWRTLRGEDAPLSLHTMQTEFDQVAARVGALAQLAGRAASPGPITAHDTLADLVSALSNDPNAMVITGETVLSGRVLPVTYGCATADAEDPVSFDISADPLLSRFWTYTATPRLPDIARAFLVFATGPEAQRSIDRAGFVDKRPDPIPLTLQGDRLAQAILLADDAAGFPALQETISRLDGHDRLSVTFRFTPGTADLEPSSLSDVQSMASFLDAGFYDDQELLFAGFSDGVGAAGPNQELSQERAGVVRDAVIAAMVTNPERASLIAAGFGEVMPLACDTSAWGRHINRRVEVWVAPEP